MQDKNIIVSESSTVKPMIRINTPKYSSVSSINLPLNECEIDE